MTKYILYVLFSLTLLIAKPLFADLPTLGDPTLSGFNQKEEERLGQAFYSALRASLDFVDDVQLNDYLNSLGQKLASHSDAAGNTFRFFIINSPAINAFAGPDAHIGINSGLFLEATNESQLAGVMAHETAHVSQRHIARSIDESGVSGAAVFATIVAAVLLGSQDPEAGTAVLATGIASVQQASLNFTRDNEYEADRIGIGILSRAGINPNGMVEFFQILLSQNRSNSLEYLRTHPLNTNRITEAQHRITEDKFGLPANSIDFQLSQARLSVLVSSYPEKIIALKRDKKNLVSEYQQALALIATQKTRKAIIILKKLQKQSKHPWIRLALAEAYNQISNTENALSILEKLSSLYPGYLPVSLAYAKTLIKNDEAQKSITVLKHQLQTTDDAILHKTLASAYFDNGQISAALESTGNQYLRQNYFELALQQYQNAFQQPEISFSTEKRLEAKIEKLEQKIKTVHAN